MKIIITVPDPVFIESFRDHCDYIDIDGSTTPYTQDEFESNYLPSWLNDVSSTLETLKPMVTAEDIPTLPGATT